MSKYLKNFETHVEYEAYTADTENFIKPNVSYCINVPNEVHYNPLEPTPTRDYVEIGGVKWAIKNLGAEKITDIGLYYQWGDTQGYTADQVGEGDGKKYFGWGDYKFCNVPSSPRESNITKYNNTDGKTELDAEDDAATVALGSDWRIPSANELIHLNDYTNSAYTYDYKSTGVNGLILTAKDGSGAELFLPDGGYCGDGRFYDNAHYLSGSRNPENALDGGHYYFSNSRVNFSSIHRYYGALIRPVFIK